MSKASDSIVRVFAYGSNMSAGRFQARVSDARPVAVGKLPGHALTFDKLSLDGSAKANVMAAPGQEVWGAVWEMPAAELPTLDGWEPRYERRVLEVLTGEGPVRAEVYVASPGQAPDGLRPYDWYKNHIVQGAKQQGLPTPYVEWLEQVESMPDPDADRDRLERSRSPVVSAPVPEED